MSFSASFKKNCLIFVTTNKQLKLQRIFDFGNNLNYKTPIMNVTSG